MGEKNPVVTRLMKDVFLDEEHAAAVLRELVDEICELLAETVSQSGHRDQLEFLLDNGVESAEIQERLREG